MTKARTSVGVWADGRPKLLFRIGVGIKGDLLILPKHAPFFQALGEKGGPRPAISHQRYSVHPSEMSPTRINVITHTFKVAGRPERQRRNHTRAVKGDRFEILFVARAPDLRVPRYDCADPNMIRLVGFRPASNVLYWMIAVSSAGLPGLRTQVDDIGQRVISAGDFDVTLIWSFARGIPSDPSGWRNHFESRAPTPSEGYSPLELVHKFREVRGALQEQMIGQHPRAGPMMRESAALLGFHREPLTVLIRPPAP